MLSGLDAKSASCFLKNSHAMVGQVIVITWTFPRRIHAISVFISSIILCIHLVGELFANISGRLPTIGHGFGPGGSLYFLGFWDLFLFFPLFPKGCKSSCQETFGNDIRGHGYWS
ncbi:isoleucine N-monooxygenase [Trifolium repens]|nr:isoleucine N-monooxygenase [Trifolium repens]